MQQLIEILWFLVDRYFSNSNEKIDQRKQTSLRVYSCLFLFYYLNIKEIPILQFKKMLITQVSYAWELCKEKWSNLVN